MRLYNSRLVQLLVVVLYAIMAFGLLAGWNMINPWIDIVCIVLFCALWGNIRYLLLSTVVMLVTAVPVWWFIVVPYMPQAQDFIGWYPLIIINFLLFVLLPEIILVSGRNAVIRKFFN